MIDDFERVGDILKRTRTAKSVSLASISKRTKISQRYLEAIERGAWDALPNEVFVRAFLRQFARTLGLEEEEMVELYRQEVGETTQSAIPSRPPSAPPILWISVGVFVVILVVAGFYLLRPERPPLPVPPASPVKVLSHEETTARPEEVVVSFTKACWITVTLDGNRVYEGLKKAGDELRYIIKDSLILKAGDGSALTVKQNGVPVVFDTLPGRPVNVSLHSKGVPDGRTGE